MHITQLSLGNSNFCWTSVSALLRALLRLWDEGLHKLIDGKIHQILRCQILKAFRKLNWHRIYPQPPPAPLIIIPAGGAAFIGRPKLN